jgi:hypothetical protein
VRATPVAGLVGVLVGVEALDADLFKAGEEFADAVVVVDPVLGFLGLVLGEVAPDGLVFEFAGPVPVGAVQAWGSWWQAQPGLPQRVWRWVMVPGSTSAERARRASSLAICRASSRWSGWSCIGWIASGLSQFVN